MKPANEGYAFGYNRKAVRQKGKAFIAVIVITTTDNNMGLPQGGLIIGQPVRKNLGAGH